MAPGERRGDGHGERVAVLHVRQLVGQDARQLLLGEHAEEARGRRDRGVLRVAAGGEGVRLCAVDDVDARHRHGRPSRELLDDGVKARRGGAVRRLRPVHGQHHLVGVPVGEEVHRHGHGERDHHAGAAADQPAHAEEQPGQGRQQKSRSNRVHRAPPACGRPAPARLKCGPGQPPRQELGGSAG